MRCRPSGLTKQNEELHARLSADEMSVADRTRKRTHEETQCTQSPTKVVVSPPRPRPVKKVRRVSKSQEANESEASEDEANPPVVSQSVSEPASEPVSEPSSSPATQPAPESGPRARAATSKAAGKKRRRPDVPAPDSKLAELQKQNDEFAKAIAVNSVALIKKTEEATKNEQDLAASRKENATLKKAHEEEMTKLKNEGAAELAKAKAEAAIELAKQTKSAKQKFDELRQERDNLRKIINDVLADPKAPSQVKTVVELDMTIKASQDELSLQTQQHDQSETTPPSKRQLVEIERKKEMALRLMSVQRARIQTQQRVAEQSEEERKLAESIAQDPTNLSGSSQSQDSIDAGQLRNGRRDSQLSIASNEHSEPSPGDLAQTLDEEIKSIDTSQGQPPLFTQFGASTDNSNRPATLSKPPVFRPVLESMTTRLEGSQESKSQQGEGFDEETKGN
ncbi:unnamed protein product [Phytophthora lilii]|uniref:Unnamed protein product n=1 Tax=Phytophthora lilii TaxID=2077276 RepID=A0A9W6WUW5_9STRA|nr:unnamed protein product [Phytophthora lilii]